MEIKPRKITIGNYSMAVGKSRQPMELGSGRQIWIIVDSIELEESPGIISYTVMGKIEGTDIVFPWKRFVNGMIAEYDIQDVLE
jgi:hypothetical protein